MNEIYSSPLCERYASRAMQEIFSPCEKIKTWRSLWIALAEAENELGLPVTQEQIDELKEHRDEIDFDMAAAIEKDVRHDVMAHVKTYGTICPKARPIIHWGATSCYVGDNADLIIMTKAMKLVRSKLLKVISSLKDFAAEYKALPTLAYTHYQPAQPTTVGKRATLWLHDLCMDLQELNYRISSMKLLGSKGTTGTQASFMELFNNDNEKVRAIDTKIAEKMGFDGVYPVSGQTYSRKIDSYILNVLSGIAQSAHKFSNDMRLLQHMQEVEEPFGKQQIGSSAMPYKRNPMRCERMGSLARYVIADAMNPAMTASEQWFERTLDDSANKRISIPEAFLCIDGILELYYNVISGVVVYPAIINKNLMKELPFMLTEEVMMNAVKKGGDRQELHEKIRQHSMEAVKRVRSGDGVNDLMDRIAADSAFGITREELDDLLEPGRCVGRSEQQVTEFIEEIVEPMLAGQEAFDWEIEIRV